MFKNVIPFTVPAEWPRPDWEQVADAHQFEPIGPMQGMARGFMPALYERAKSMVHRSMGFTLLMVRTDIRRVPPAAIAEEADLRAEAIFEREGRRPGRRQMLELREEVERDLRPRAFPRTTITPILLTGDLVLVGTSSRAQADDLLGWLRHIVGSLPALPLDTVATPEMALTVWLADGVAPDGLTLGYACQLHGPAGDASAAVRVTHHDLRAEEIKAHLLAGKRCRQLAMVWTDAGGHATSFAVDAGLCLRGIKMDDVLLRQAADESEDDATYFDATFLIEARTLAGLLDAVVKAMGGDRRAVKEGQPT